MRCVLEALLGIIADCTTVQNMNYTCLVVGGLAILQLGWWFKVSKPYSARMARTKEETMR